MAQITELKHEEQTRRRTTRVVAVLGVTVLVAGAGWFAMSQLSTGSDTAPPASAPSPSISAFTLEPGPTVGTNLQPRLVAKAPDSWAVMQDADYVNLGTDAGMFVEIDGPILQVFDPEQNAGVSIPPGGYASWLREHPFLEVLDDQMVVVDGQRFPQLTMKVAGDIPDDSELGSGVPLGRSFDMAESQRWPKLRKGQVITQTVIEVDGKTMVVSSYGALDDAEQAELDAARDLVLSTMKLPD
jgi:hypothetical protein